MPEVTQPTGSRLRAYLGPRLAGWGHFFGKLTHHLPAALIVTSLVAIGHHQFHLLDAIDGYAFLGVGNLSAIDASHSRLKDPTVAVVGIDDKSHEDFFRQRSPLNRCELQRDLESLYLAVPPPKLLVIDLDLSPALSSADGLVARQEAECEEKLWKLLERNSDIESVQRTTRTVLMKPFSVLDSYGQGKISRWIERMEAAGIAFGDATLLVRYGLVIKIGCKAENLAAVAFNTYRPEHTENCLSEDGKGGHGKPKQLMINPRQYTSGLRAVSVTDLPSRNTSCAQNAGLPREVTYNLPVVFFGASYGDDDTYLTPVGTLYGVDVHAAAYMSLLEPTSDFTELTNFLFEVAIALALGGGISWCWRRYYSMRFSSEAFERQLSPFLIFLLGAALAVLVLGLTILSFYVMNGSNYWLSPIPIAIGMLVESFFNGAVHEAVGEGYEQRKALITRLARAHKTGPEEFTKSVAAERRQRPREVHHIKERVMCFLYLDVKRLYKKHKYGASVLLLLRRLAFVGVLIWGFLVIYY